MVAKFTSQNRIFKEHMKKAIIAVILLIFSLSTSFSHPQWKLVWSDDFDYSGLPDNTKWGYDVGGSGWGNRELQYYTKEKIENAHVENGTLTRIIHES
jgi:hypothetical protein